MVQPELGTAVDVLRAAEPFLQGEARFVQERDEHAIHDEPWHIVGADQILAHAQGQRACDLDRLIGGL
jgi:hypothetical protein